MKNDLASMLDEIVVQT